MYAFFSDIEFEYPRTWPEATKNQVLTIKRPAQRVARRHVSRVVRRYAWSRTPSNAVARAEALPPELRLTIVPPTPGLCLGGFYRATKYSKMQYNIIK